MNKALNKYWVLLLCLLGSFVRLLFGYYYELWTQAPDQLAWELVIEQGNFSYDHLIHYPHEGGTILVSLLSYIVEIFTNFSSLTFSAVIIDFAVRYIQIRIVKKIFNTQVAFLFALWTIFATPSIIPWGTVNFGLHSLSSVFPFIFLFLLSQKKDSPRHQIVCGIFLGLAFWFSYSNFILIPVFFLYGLVSKMKVINWVYSVLSLVSVVVVHLMARLFLDAGFHLSELDLLSIRGESFSINEINIWNQLSYMLSIISNSAMALPKPSTYAEVIKLIYYAFCLLSGIGFYIAYKKHRFKKSIYLIFPIILLFLITYLLSPFSHLSDTGSYISFRHLTYILPLASLAIISGLSSLRYKAIVVLFLLLGTYRSSKLFTMDKAPENDIITKASGWVLATKLGHNTEAVSSIIIDNPEKRELLIQGVGWGISTALMSDINKLDISKSDSKINELVELISKYPESFQGLLLEGVKFSFSDNVTPRLNSDLLVKIEETLNKRSTTKPKLH